ncbi:Amino Acid-Polyamine-Organocation (APC) Family [Phytophthora cinnamomi]|uniref:Amino Acid-Polyamine-Organocation (APC) Family n=1 Tax=Phytophthora cinnamomi TaxID=4785 RepID=UPI003559B321|nr:Amino Acid-Polyamine-Organocation (APC) Family [Phytophthora cinnamomi]
MDPAVLEVPYRKSGQVNRRPMHHRVMGTLSIAAVTYFFGCGGPLGSEPIISSTGPAIGLPAMVLYPLLVMGPYAYIVVELCCAFPEDGGFAIWVLNAFGPFWGFQVGYWSWMAGIFNTALLPGFLLQILSDSYGVSIEPGVACYATKTALAVLFTMPSVLGTKVASRSCVILLVCVLVPVLIFTVWGYSRARDYEDLSEVRHESIELHAGDNIQVGEKAIDWALLLNTLFWKYDGINIASVFGGEVANPAGIYSRAVTLTVVLTVLTYLVPMPAAIIVDDPNWTYFTRDSYPQIAASIGGPVLKALFVFSSCCAAAGLFISGVFCEAFQLAGMGESQLLPACFAWRSTQFDAPFVSIGITVVFTIALLGVDFDDLLPMTNVFASAVQLMIMLTAIRLRKLLPYIPRPTKVPGGKRVLVALAILPTAMLGYIVFDAFSNLTSAAIILAFLVPGLGYGLYGGYQGQAREFVCASFY